MIISEPLVGFPCYTELTSTDPAGAAAFYGGLFGWTAVRDRFLLDSAVVAGLADAARWAKPPQGTKGWTMAIGVEDADLAAQAVRAAGGTILADPQDDADRGRTAIAADPTGAVFSLWQARSFLGSERIFEDGTLVWSELTTGDTAAAKAFYVSVFGWSVAEGRMGDQIYTQFGLAGEDFGGMTGDPGAESGWLPHFGTSDVDATVERAEDLGATVVVPPEDIPGTGRYARLTDPQNAAFALYAQPEAA